MIPALLLVVGAAGLASRSARSGSGATGAVLSKDQKESLASLVRGRPGWRLSGDAQPGRHLTEIWRGFGETGGPDLSHTRLTRMWLEGVDWSGANLQDAIVSGSVFRNVDLRGAHLVGLRARDTQFKSCELAGADLSESKGNLSYWWRCNMPKARLTDAAWKSAKIRLSNLEGVNADGASLLNLQLDRCRARGASFQGADLEGIVAGSPIAVDKLRKVAKAFRQAVRWDRSGSGIRIARRGATGHGLALTWEWLTLRADQPLVEVLREYHKMMVEQGWDGPEWSNYELQPKQITFTDNPAHIDLTYARLNLGYTDLRQAVFTGARLRKGDFWGADLQGAKLAGVDARGTSFRFANLVGADLTGADLRGADLRGAWLKDTVLDQIKEDDATKWFYPAKMGLEGDVNTMQFWRPEWKAPQRRKR